ncbi:MAG: hypothetical protein ACK4ND_00170 [Cytophagaceae bacterium]
MAERLHEIGIEYILEDNSAAVDITFSANTSQNEVQLKIKQEDFEKANKLLESESEIPLADLDKNHYLFSFSNEELYEILLKKDEWSAFDYKLAQKILAGRGQKITPEELEGLRKKRLEDLSKPENLQNQWIIIGYLLAVAGGIIGIFIGYYLWTLKKTLPTGEKVYVYNEENRKDGKNIFIIGIIVAPVVFFGKIIFDLLDV